MNFPLWALDIISSGFLFLVASGGRCQLGSWLAPSAFFPLYWFVAFFSVLVFAPNYYISPAVIWLVIIYALSLHLGIVTFYSSRSTRQMKERVVSRSLYIQLRRSKIEIFVCTIIGFITIPLLLSSKGYSLSILWDPVAVATAARNFSVARYSEGYDPPLLVRLLTCFPYVGAYIGGIVFAATYSLKSRIWAMSPLLPLALQTLLLTSRNNLVYPVLFMSASFLAVLVLQGRHYRLFTWKRVKVGFVMVVCAFAMYVGLQMMRDGVSTTSLDKCLRNLRVAALGSPSAFSIWFDQQWDNTSLTGGAYSVAGIFDQLGLTKRVQGLYGHVLYLGAANDQAESTNIYTMFRGLIQDFSLPGSILFFYLTGVCIGYVYTQIQSGRIIFLPLLALFYAVIMWGYLTSMLTYNTLVLTWIIFFLCVVLPVLWPRRLLYIVVSK